MNYLSTDRLVENRESTGSPTNTRTALILMAWLSTLLLSKLPLVIARDILDKDIPWITSMWLGVAALLFTATIIWKNLKPLRAYFIAIGAIYSWTLLDTFIRGTTIWQNTMNNQPEMVAIFADRVLLLLNAFFVIVVLLLTGIKRKDLFLTLGNLRAPVGGEAVDPKRKHLSWSLLGPGVALLLGSAFFAFLISQIPAGQSNLTTVIPWIPLILVSAAMNAFGEEVTFRAATVGTLLPVVGPRHALWLTSLWFGLGHYYGGFPSGPAGLVQSGLLALLMGKAMLDTRGLGWPWMIHMAIDTVIYIFIALTVN